MQGEARRPPCPQNLAGVVSTHNSYTQYSEHSADAVSWVGRRGDRSRREGLRSDSSSDYESSEHRLPMRP